MLSGNQLTKLPESMANCTNLELIRLASNQLAEPPSVLFSLPNLAWIAVGDNPFLQSVVQQQVQDQQPLPILSQVDFSNSIVLGQGAGGVTKTAVWENQTVAVKTFGGSMTSDGTPASERLMACAVGQLAKQGCPGLIAVHGQTDQDGSLVMEYVQNHAALAGPPSLESCSRDVYQSPQQGTWFQEEAVELVSRILQALQVVHQAGICHGDVYSHNILLHQEDRSQIRLSDWGAAFFYNASTAWGAAIQKMELRAFGIFVSEVEHELLDPNEAKSELWREFQEQIRQASSFEEIHVWWTQRQMSNLVKSLDAELV